MNHLVLHFELNTPASGVVSGQARLANLVFEASGEALAIAVLGQYSDCTPFARVVTPKILKCLPQELGHACHTFGTLLVADYLSWSNSGKEFADWRAPLGGIRLGEPFDIDAEDEEGVVVRALDRCSLYRGRVDLASRAEETDPRPIHEARFAKSVKDEVLSVAPTLAQGFNRSFSLTGTTSGFSIDYVGHAYATCYAAINPKAKSMVRNKTAAAALWRLARARDAFGFATPESIELTAWIPAPGQPIYSDSEYAEVSDILYELREQAKREDLQVFSAYDAKRACSRLLAEEALTH
ncbi:hypothetical protein OOOCML_33045 (plasmid) [Cupriavidus necator H16]|uniref:Uncharacterized protein n=1 Tax=Cupriavidus necator (strain ATCC 17699 / DSM 428 / KCTC 22496 / NCIMB 10442 / H16 / Stanier 337) TaxID=381666 RepID=A0AAF1D5C7_CUPNH|nr:hypothetical protein [Cupriavidus necator]QCC05399.1 hypothetical protein E6A55_32915 [Cupriavidus necator H16]QQB81568.1 hypothetical protein I6H87_32890 [Cupriavidus necator]